MAADQQRLIAFAFGQLEVAAVAFQVALGQVFAEQKMGQKMGTDLFSLVKINLSPFCCKRSRARGRERLRTTEYGMSVSNDGG
ncbi:hypothetical protein [Pseudomonas mandelii]|uniref:hypothetical protein n=1 Tax=Pseudomonas mandelii TaxID=75612 RepID=UPI0012B437FB|nr:hypothetical protein [Pseudomonas mandelii]